MIKKIWKYLENLVRPKLKHGPGLREQLKNINPCYYTGSLTIKDLEKILTSFKR